MANLGSDSATQIDSPDGSRPARRSASGAWEARGPSPYGNDNLWASSFVGSTLTQLCGRSRSRCPPGARTGDPISPRATGFTNGHLEHLTAVQIDQSVNARVANNWPLLSPIVGGDGLVEFIARRRPSGRR